MDAIKTPKVDNVRLQNPSDPKKPLVGVLHITPMYLIFLANENDDPAVWNREIWLLHTHVLSVEKLPLTTSGAPIVFRCKTFVSYMFIIPRERDCSDVYQTVLHLSRPATIEELPAFTFKPLGETITKNTGWKFFDVRNDYIRMGIPNDYWDMSSFNTDYQNCDTYPNVLCIPRGVGTPVIYGSLKFRSRGRLPVLTYFHRKNGAAICRSSQPLAGFSARCTEDEQMLDCIVRANPNCDHMVVVDNRPRINAMAQQARGKGYENETYYSNIRFCFCGIENIHEMRSSLARLVSVCERQNGYSVANSISELNKSKWLRHVKVVLETAVLIAQTVCGGVSVLVHCSDGWDRTAQTCALGALLLDPFYRTLHGFQALIDKEWLAFGHKFNDRCGHVRSVDGREVSPVFTQFLDAVWQLLRQFPSNCEKDRVDLRLSERTYSLWGYMLQRADEFTNPLYAPPDSLDSTGQVLVPDTSAQRMQLWESMYCSAAPRVAQRDTLSDLAAAAQRHRRSLDAHRRWLQEAIGGLCRLLGKPDDSTQRRLAGMISKESIYQLADIAGSEVLDEFAALSIGEPAPTPDLLGFDPVDRAALRDPLADK